MKVIVESNASGTGFVAYVREDHGRSPLREHGTTAYDAADRLADSLRGMLYAAETMARELRAG